jgi:2-keto-3-deoxy-L-rhamnonate aldolase RhmA
MTDKKWNKVGYLAISRNQTCVVMKIENQRYIAEIPQVLEVLTKKSGYAPIYKPKT